MDHSDVNARPGRIKTAAWIASNTQLRSDFFQFNHQLAAHMHSADAAMEIGGMNLKSRYARRMRGNAFVRVRHMHRGWFANNDGGGAGQVHA